MTSNTRMGWPSEQEVALGHRELGGRGLLDQLAVDADGERVGVDLDARQGVVLGQVGLGQAAGVGAPARAAGRSPRRSARPSSMALGGDPRERQLAAPRPGAAPNIGRGRTGCGVGIDALASPIGAQAIIPPLTTTCGPDAEERRVPQHEVGQLADLDRADLVGRGRGRRPGRSCTWRRSGGPGGCRRRRRRAASPRRRFITCAVCQVRMTTSPMRPIAWESEPIIEIAPRSWRTSSAAMVDGRMRLSANARSSGTAGLRWWQTISMSRCSSTRVDGVRAGRVGRRRQHVGRRRPR